MKNAGFKIRTSVANVNILNEDEGLARTILNYMLISGGVLALSYILILGNMVFNIVERKALEKEALALSSEVAELELSYLNISNSVDLALSEAMGFREIQASFATRQTLGSLNTADNEI